MQIHRINDLLVAFRIEVDWASDVPGAGFASCLILTDASIAGLLGA